MNNISFKGSIVALITPFKKDGSLDLVALEKLILWHIKENTDGIVLCGTTGESPTLTDLEKLKIFETGVKTAEGKIPIIAGTGTYSTLHSKKLTQQAKDIGVDGCLVVLPYYNKPTETGCIQHFEEIAKADLPIILYHHPGRTGIKLSLEAFKKMEKIKQIVAVKDASGCLDYAKELISKTRFDILSGDDNLTLEIIKSGGKGVISVIANIIPSKWKKMNDLCLSGDFAAAQSILQGSERLSNSLLLETNPQCIKYAMSLQDKCLARMRLPLIEPTNITKTEIQQSLM